MRRWRSCKRKSNGYIDKSFIAISAAKVTKDWTRWGGIRDSFAVTKTTRLQLPINRPFNKKKACRQFSSDFETTRNLCRFVIVHFWWHERMWIFSISNGILSYRKKLSNRIWSMHFLVCFLFFSFFLFSQHEKEKCFSRLCSINILRNLYDLTEMFTLVYFHAICICIYIYASIKHRTNTGNIRNYITLPLVYMIRNNYRAWNVIAATERFSRRYRRYERLQRVMGAEEKGS